MIPFWSSQYPWSGFDSQCTPIWSAYTGVDQDCNYCIPLFATQINFTTQFYRAYLTLTEMCSVYVLHCRWIQKKRSLREHHKYRRLRLHLPPQRLQKDQLVRQHTSLCSKSILIFTFTLSYLCMLIFCETFSCMGDTAIFAILDRLLLQIIVNRMHLKSSFQICQFWDF